jgi:uncharacterized protein (TIGR02099 family)
VSEQRSSNEPAVPGRDSRARRVVRWLAGIAAALVIVLALALGALRVLLTHVPDYRNQIQAWVNDTTHLDVRFRELDARWRFFGPEIYISAVEVYAPHGGPLLAEARAASVGFDFWRALLHAELLPGRLRLIEPEIGLVRTADGRIEIEGQAALEAQSSERRFNMNDLPTGRLDITDARVTFTDLKGQLRDIIVTAADVTVRRGRNDLEVQAELPLPEGLGATLEVEGQARGSLQNPAQLHWEVALRARSVELAGWREQFGVLATLPTAGQGNLRLAAVMEGRELESAKLRLQLEQVVLPAGGASPSTRYPVIAGDFDLTRDGDEWRLTGRDLELSTDRYRWTRSGLSTAWKRNGSQLANFDVQATYLRIENLVPFVGLAPTSAWRERILALSPEGEVRAFKVGYARGQEAVPDVKVAARFSNLGFGAYGRFPGLQGLSGEASGSSAAGRITIESRALRFTMPGKFRSPLSADLARGQVGWTHDASGWHIQSQQFELRNAHASADTDIDLRLPGGGESPVLKLRSRFRDAVVAEGWRYFPVDKLKGKVLAWLDGAFLAGRAPSGEFVIDGPTRKFPFRNGEGEFRVSFPVEGLTLLYADGWPRLENGSVDVEFHNAGLTARVKKATLNGLAVEEGAAQIADFKEGDLLIKGRAAGDAGAALGFVQGSPAGEKLGATFMKLRGSGPVRADVDLALPIRHLDDRHIVIATRLEGAQVALAESAHVVESLTGELHIDDKKVSSPGLGGTYLGGPIRIELTPTAEAGGVFENVVRVRASSSAPALAAALGAPDMVKVDGRIDWRASARIPIAATEAATANAPPSSLRIDSALRGTVIGLPAPLAKSAPDTRTTHVEVQWPKDDEALVRAAYGTILRSQLRFARGADGWTFDRGTVRLGAGDTRLPPMAGLELRGTVDELDLSDWLALRSGKPGKRALSDYLRSVDLTAQDLVLFGFRFSDLHTSLLAGERAWSASVEGAQARGTILVPYDLQGSEPLVLTMTRLRLNPANEEDASGEKTREPDPAQWPNVNVSVAEFEAWGKKLGFLRAELRRTTDGIVLQSVNTQAATFTLHGSGAWSAGPQGQQSALKVELASTDMLQTLRDLGYGATLTGKHGSVVADVTWPGAPDAELLARLNGTVSIQIDDGQLLGVQPGAGRIFGLMSVAALPRRLSLDFTDFTDKGLAFDSVRGDFTLKAGDAYTENLLLKGPAAEIGVVGRTGLGQRDYDQTAVVTGSLGQSLPVAGALAAGPVVGAALLVFSQIFKEPLKGITRGYYRITGSWDNPEVQRVEDSDKKKAESAVRTAERKADLKP